MLLILRQRTKEIVDGQRHAFFRRRLHEMQDAVQDGQTGAARRQADVIGLHRHPVLGLHDRHRGASTQQARQETDMARMLVRHHHEGHPAAGRHVTKELFHGLQPAGGGADADGQETRRFCRQRCRRSRFCGRPRDSDKRLLDPLVLLDRALGTDGSSQRLTRSRHRLFSSISQNPPHLRHC